MFTMRIGLPADGPRGSAAAGLPAAVRQESRAGDRARRLLPRAGLRRPLAVAVGDGHAHGSVRLLL